MKNVLGGRTGTQRLIVHKQKSNVLMYERLGLTDEHVQLERQLKNRVREELAIGTMARERCKSAHC